MWLLLVTTGPDLVHDDDGEVGGLVEGHATHFVFSTTSSSTTIRRPCHIWARRGRCLTCGPHHR
jgi:hypothetical protein